MSDYKTVKYPAVGKEPEEVEFESTIEVDREALMQAVQDDQQQSSEDYATVKMEVPAHLVLDDGPTTTNFEVPETLRNTTKPAPTLEIHMELVDQIVDEVERPEVEFLATIAPDGTVKLPVQFLGSAQGRPGTRLRFVVFKA